MNRTAVSFHVAIPTEADTLPFFALVQEDDPNKQTLRRSERPAEKARDGEPARRAQRAAATRLQQALGAGVVARPAATAAVLSARGLSPIRSRRRWREVSAPRLIHHITCAMVDNISTSALI